MKRSHILLSVFFAFAQLCYSQVPIPVGAQERPVILMNGTAHIGNGQVIENSVVAFADGKLTLVADASELRMDLANYEIISATGKHIYPGFILPNSQLGLSEVSSIRAMSDMEEEGDFNSNVRAQIAYNTDSENIPTMRFNGILLAEATPTGGIISGRSSIMELEGWNWEDATHTADVAMHVDWPAKMRRSFDFATFTVAENPNPDYDAQVQSLNDFFTDARSYTKLTNKQANLKMEAMQGLFNGSMTLVLHTSGAKEIVEAVQLAKAQGVKRIAVVAGTEALYVAEFLRDNAVGVIIPPVHSLPSRADEDIHLPYKLPHLLTEAGLKVSLSHSGMLANARNLPFYAGTAIAYGMDPEEALKTISANTAEILGIDKRVGTLENGKDATLIVTEGDVFDIRTSILTHAFISGKQVILDNKQQALYKRYSDKYGH